MKRRRERDRAAMYWRHGAGIATEIALIGAIFFAAFLIIYVLGWLVG